MKGLNSTAVKPKKKGRPYGSRNKTTEDVDLLKEVKSRLESEISELGISRDNAETQLLDAQSRLEQAKNLITTDDRKESRKMKEETDALKEALARQKGELDKRERQISHRELTLVSDQKRMGVMDEKIVTANKRISDAAKIEKQAKMMMAESQQSYEDAKALQATEHQLAESNAQLQARLKLLEEDWMTKIGHLDERAKQMDLELTKVKAQTEMREVVHA